MRAPLAGVSALLVVSLFLGASINASKPVVGQTVRDAAADRVAVRELTASLARAVRHLVGSDQHKPCLQIATDRRSRVTSLTGDRIRNDAGGPRGMKLLRSDLLDLPPPLMA